jgi:hypothetical protein
MQGDKLTFLPIEINLPKVYRPMNTIFYDFKDSFLCQFCDEATSFRKIATSRAYDSYKLGSSTEL